MNEEKKTSDHDIPSTFSQLVIMIATSALQQLGQVPDPSGKRGEVHLDGAQGMIDILETLNEKTKGNLDEDEKKILTESLTMLRLQFVEIKKALERQSAGEKKETPAEAAKSEAAPSPAADEEPIKPSGSSDESKTRYRKSYG
jgi:hypothetical protein